MPAERTIGRVVDESGNPVVGFRWELDDSSMGSQSWGLTDSNGDYNAPCTGPSETFPRTWVLALVAEARAALSYGDPALNFAYTFVGGGTTLASASAAPCMTADATPIVTVVHQGGILTGKTLGPPDNPNPDAGYSVHCTCDSEFNFQPGAQNGRYQIVGLPPGDYDIRPNGSFSPPAVVHIEAGQTTTFDLG